MAGIKLINGDKIQVVESMELVMTEIKNSDVAIKVTEIGELISIDAYMNNRTQCYDPIYIMIRNILTISEH